MEKTTSSRHASLLGKLVLVGVVDILCQRVFHPLQRPRYTHTIKVSRCIEQHLTGRIGMASWPSLFDLCKPRREVLAGELPDAIFAADLWDVIASTAHKDYRDPLRFFAGTHPTENLKLLVKEVAERLAGGSAG